MHSNLKGAYSENNIFLSWRLHLSYEKATKFGLKDEFRREKNPTLNHCTFLDDSEDFSLHFRCATCFLSNIC